MTRHPIDTHATAAARRRAPWSALVALLAMLGACGENPPSDPAPTVVAAPTALVVPAGAPKVIVLGDSISAGLHLERPLEDSYPAVLQRRLVRAGLPFELVNAGVSGDTTAGGLRRLDWMLKQEPDLLIVELGANDGLRGVPLDSVEENLRGIVSGAQAARVPVLLLGMRVPPNLGADYVAGFAAVYSRVAAELGVRVVDFFMQGVAGEPDRNFPDGIHPTAAGHAILADNVEPMLRELLTELGGEPR